MALSRKQFERAGGAVVENGVSHPSDPDQSLVIVRVTIDGHTVERTGKDLKQILAELEPLLRRAGRLDGDEEERVYPPEEDGDPED